MNDQGKLGEALWDRHTQHHHKEGELVYNVKPQGSRMMDTDAQSIQEAGQSNFQENDEMRYLADTYQAARNQLYLTQKSAGMSMGFNDKYAQAYPDYEPSYYDGPDGTFTDPYGDYQPFRTEAYHGLDQNGWALYQDGTWEFGPLDTAAQLHDALAKIEASGDVYRRCYRNEDQRAYLAQKAYTRYLFSKVNQLGGHD